MYHSYHRFFITSKALGCGKPALVEVISDQTAMAALAQIG